MNLIISYILGSINFSFIISEILKLEIQNYGDENLGATNIYYASLKKYKNKNISLLLFLIAGILDLLKAYIPTVLFGPLAGTFAVIGHCFSIFSIIITKKIPSGVGAASAIGWLLGLDVIDAINILVIAIPLLIIGIILFHDIFKIERLHTYSIFLFLSSVLLYIIIFNPNMTLKLSATIVAVSSSFANILRFKALFKKMINKSPGGGI